MKACWLGGTRYTCPLNPTQAKKWQALAGLGVEMTVVGFADDLRPRAFAEHARFYLLPQLPTPLLRHLEMFTLAPLLLLWLIMARGVSVIIAQSPFEGAAGALAKRLAGVFGRRAALVIESHGDFEVTVFAQRRVRFAGLYRWLMRRAARFAFRQADALRAISDSTRQQLEQWSPGKPLEQFLTWTDAGAFADAPREIPLSRSRDVLYAGVLTPLKNVHVLIEAFGRLIPEIEPPSQRDASQSRQERQERAQNGEKLPSLWLVGQPENADYAEALRAQVERLGLAERVQFVGAVSQTELAGYMRRARLLALPSASEGLGRVLVEAMLCGTPVIGSRVGGIPDVIQDGVNGYLVPPGDVRALAAALQAMFEQPDIEAMGERARAFAQAFFSKAAYVGGYRRLFQQVVYDG